MRAFTGDAAHKIIDVEFNYNGNLGTLQAMTRANAETAYYLWSEKVITDTEYTIINTEIHRYFTAQLEKAIKAGSTAYML